MIATDGETEVITGEKLAMQRVNEAIEGLKKLSSQFSILQMEN